MLKMLMLWFIITTLVAWLYMVSKAQLSWFLPDNKITITTLIIMDST